MADDPQEKDLIQQNIDPASAEKTGEDWTLEQIMDEFGGWSKKEETQKAPEQQTPPEKAIWTYTPEPAEEPNEKPPEKQVDDSDVKSAPLKSLRIFRKPTQDATIRFEPVGQAEEENGVWTYKAEPTPEQNGQDDREEKKRQRQANAAKKRQMRILRRQRRLKNKDARRREAPEHTFSGADEALEYYSKATSAAKRLPVSILFTLLSAAMLALCSVRFGTAQTAQNEALLAKLMLAALLLQAIVCYDVFLEGTLRVLQLRFDQKSLILLMTVVSVIDAFFAISEGRTPFCTAVSAELTAALWSDTLKQAARRRSIRAACAMKEPAAAVKEEKAWHGINCIFRAQGDLEAFALQLELPDAGTRIMRVYAPICTVLTLMLAALSSLNDPERFLWAWSALLIMGSPVGYMIAFWSPFSARAKRLLREGGAIAGWHGARQLGGECGLVIEDADLFPPENVTLSGMKIHADMPLNLVVGYAEAVVKTAGSGLVPLFEDMMREQNGKHCTVETFRRYEGGGLGAEIHGDIVLMGSLAFMKLMRVRMPDDIRLKQAVYLSVNGDLAGVFALTYTPDKHAKDAIAAVLRSGGLVPMLATRDFMITPQLLQHHYNVPTDRIEFPTVEERARLSSLEAIRDGRQGALMDKNTFSAFAQLVCAARAVRTAAIWSMIVSCIGSLLGTVVVFFLTLTGSVLAASCWNLLLFMLLWLMPVLLISWLFSHSL